MMRFAVPPGGRWRAAGNNLTRLVSPPGKEIEMGVW
jgi:hypothetical protein